MSPQSVFGGFRGLSWKVRLLQQHWAWLPGWTEGAPASPVRRVRYRHEWTRPDTPSSTAATVIHLSADTRYRLYVNGSPVATGPAPGSERVWYYDSIDLSSRLKPGRNLIEVVVLRCDYQSGVFAGIGRTRTAGLTFVGRDGSHDLSMGDTWRVIECTEYQHALHVHDGRPSNHIYENAILPPTTTIWQLPTLLRQPNHFGVQPSHNLSPNCLPQPDQAVIRPLAIRHADSEVVLSKWTSWLWSDSNLVLPAHSRHSIDIEYVEPVTGSWVVEVIARRGISHIQVGYSGSYSVPSSRDSMADGEQLPCKRARTGRATEVHSGDPSDRYSVVGPAVVQIEPFGWRAFRFLRLDIQTADEPLELKSFTAHRTAYPLHPGLSVNVKDTEMAKMVDVSLRTMRNSLLDSYLSDPVDGEQQNGIETYLSMLYHYHVSGDDRLARQTIAGLASSVLSDGLLQACNAAHSAQVITVSSLHWILAVCDQYLYFGDDAFSKQYLHTIDGILAFFDRHIGHLGLIQRLPRGYWHFIDRVFDCSSELEPNCAGTPACGRTERRWTFITLLYSYTLRRAAQLTGDLGRRSIGNEYIRRASEAATAARRYCYDGRYFSDSVAAGPRSYSKHCQILAVLAGASSDTTEARRLLDACFDQGDTKGPPLTPCSLSMRHHMFRALAQTGLYETYFEIMWKPWHRMLERNLSTWGDTEDEEECHSDCYTPSCAPMYELSAEVCGLKPRHPGFRSIDFNPRISLYKSARFEVPIGSLGIARVRWKRSEEGYGRVVLELPRAATVYSRMGILDPDDGESIYPDTKEVVMDIQPSSKDM